MSPEKIAEAFQPFKQLDNSLARRFEGAGLGLSICKALVELHGGTLFIPKSAQSQRAPPFPSICRQGAQLRAALAAVG